MTAVTVVAVAMAVGLALLLSRVGGALNPMSAALGALAVGLGGYAAIIVCRLYREGRAEGNSSEAAVTRAFGLGGVLLSSGTMALVGFGILIVSDVQMLRDFGWLAVLDLAIVLTALGLVLPAALVWGEQRKPLPRSREAWADLGRAGRQRGRGAIAAVSRPLRRRGEAQEP